MKDIIIYELSFNQEDVIECMDDELKEKFKKLPEKKQEKLIKEYADSISKGLDSGLMSDWTFVMSTAIDCSGIAEAVEEALSK